MSRPTGYRLSPEHEKKVKIQKALRLGRSGSRRLHGLLAHELPGRIATADLCVAGSLLHTDDCSALLVPDGVRDQGVRGGEDVAHRCVEENRSDEAEQPVERVEVGHARADVNLAGAADGLGKTRQTRGNRHDKRDGSSANCSRQRSGSDRAGRRGQGCQCSGA